MKHDNRATPNHRPVFGRHSRHFQKLEDHDIELEEAINLYSQGVALGKACQDKLNQAQEKIKVLTADSETLIDPEQLGSAADV